MLKQIIRATLLATLFLSSYPYISAASDNKNTPNNITVNGVVKSTKQGKVNVECRILEKNSDILYPGQEAFAIYKKQKFKGTVTSMAPLPHEFAIFHVELKDPHGILLVGESLAVEIRTRHDK